MKRDMGKVRALLLLYERGVDIAAHDLDAAGISTDEHAEYVKLLAEAGFVRDLIDTSTVFGESYTHNGITSAGHDFLDAVRDDRAWRYIQTYIDDVGGLPTTIVQELGEKWLKNAGRCA